MPTEIPKWCPDTHPGEGSLHTTLQSRRPLPLLLLTAAGPAIVRVQTGRDPAAARARWAGARGGGKVMGRERGDIVMNSGCIAAQHSPRGEDAAIMARGAQLWACVLNSIYYVLGCIYMLYIHDRYSQLNYWTYLLVRIPRLSHS